MKHSSTAVAACVGLFGLVLPPFAMADAWNHKTKLTFSEPIEVPGKVLPAGEYTFKLMDSQSDRHIVEIYNADETKLEATALTIPDKRLKVTGKTVVKFSERPSNSPEALKAWFYPGAIYGEEFVYPHDRAASLSQSNKQPVFSTRSDMSGYMNKPMNSDNDPDANQMRKSVVMVMSPDGKEIDFIEFDKMPNK